MFGQYFSISLGVDIIGAFLDNVRCEVFMTPKQPPRLRVQRESSGNGPDRVGTDPDFLSWRIAYSSWILTLSGLPRFYADSAFLMPSCRWTKDTTQSLRKDTSSTSFYCFQRTTLIWTTSSDCHPWNKIMGSYTLSGVSSLCVSGFWKFPLHCLRGRDVS